MGLQELMASEEHLDANRALRVATGLPCAPEGISTASDPAVAVLSSGRQAASR